MYIATSTEYTERHNVHVISSIKYAQVPNNAYSIIITIYSLIPPEIWKKTLIVISTLATEDECKLTTMIEIPR